MCTLAGAERLFLPLSVSVKGSEGFSERSALCTGLHINTFQVSAVVLVLEISQMTLRHRKII